MTTSAQAPTVVLSAGPAIPRGSGADGPRRGQRFARAATPYVFLIVPVGLLLLLTYVPVGNMLGYSITDWDGVDRDRSFVGADNYVAIFSEPENVRVFVVTLYYVASAVVQIALALYFAVILSTATRFRNMWKGILFFPYMINGVAIGLVFTSFFRPEGGLDATLTLIGADALIRQWTGDPAVINVSLAAVSVWRYFGFNFVIFLGAIQSIRPEVMEAVQLDGANRWQQFVHVVLPSIRPVVGLVTIVSIAGSLSVFEIPYVMTGGANGSETFVIRTIKEAFVNNNVGLASAMAVVLLLFILVVTWLQRRIVPDRKVDLT